MSSQEPPSPIPEPAPQPKRRFKVGTLLGTFLVVAFFAGLFALLGLDGYGQNLIAKDRIKAQNQLIAAQRVAFVRYGRYQTIAQLKQRFPQLQTDLLNGRVILLESGRAYQWVVVRGGRAPRPDLLWIKQADGNVVCDGWPGARCVEWKRLSDSATEVPSFKRYSAVGDGQDRPIGRPPEKQP